MRAKAFCVVGIGGVDRARLAIGYLAALCCGSLAHSAVVGADEPAAQRAADLAPPVLVMAGGKPIDVDGYAAPFVGDFDGDGKNDPLVGQYVYGKLRIYRNVGTRAEPKFDTFEWFTVGGLPACVPAGCHVGFTPQLVDFDGDGRLDLLVGDTYTDENELPEPATEQQAKDEKAATTRNDCWSEIHCLTGTRSQGETVQEHDERWRKVLRTLQEVAASDPDGTQVARAKRHGRVWLYARTAASGEKP
ncbi:MAG: VCBS repeat-containing protein [Planctomycetes bacterium]|nr:VCBS repeat-containing protein [Planctomycetota bacterium]